MGEAFLLRRKIFRPAVLSCSCGAPLDDDGKCTMMEGPACVGWEETEVTLTCDGACGLTFTGHYEEGQTCPNCGEGCLW